MEDYCFHFECHSESKQAANCRQTTQALCHCGAPRVSFRDCLPFRESAFLREKTIFPRGLRSRERGLDQPFLPLPTAPPPHRRSVMMRTRRAPRSDGVVARYRGGGLNSGNRRKSDGGGCDDCRDDDGAGGSGGAGAARTGEGLAGGAGGLDCGSDGQGG